MFLIGDIHGKTEQYKKIIDGLPDGALSIQIGDFGFKDAHEWHLTTNDVTRHKVLFGNHDDANYRYREHSLGDFGMYEGVFFIRGASSIDREWRIPDVSWWYHEEMEYSEMLECMDLYTKLKPRIVVAHDAPEGLYPMLGIRWPERNRTMTFLQNLWDVHEPDLWIHGHHHQSTTHQLGSTTFRCLDELELYELEIDYCDCADKMGTQQGEYSCICKSKSDMM